MDNVIDMDEFKATQFAKEFVAENGLDAFVDLQKDLRELLSLAEDLGLVPDEVIQKHGSIKNFKGE